MHRFRDLARKWVVERVNKMKNTGFEGKIKFGFIYAESRTAPVEMSTGCQVWVRSSVNHQLRSRSCSTCWSCSREQEVTVFALMKLPFSGSSGQEQKRTGELDV